MQMWTDADSVLGRATPTALREQGNDGGPCSDHGEGDTRHRGSHLK